ncbi:MAG: hypothetical protein EP344_16875 [Bacteroidetes bacterium]|nr:MAG: hypothetical protein EP344_16875 [Bacteroidota bacterium]
MAQPDVLHRMDQHIGRWQPGADGKAIFLRCYRTMTHNMLTALDRGAFSNAGWTDLLLHHFAEYYFRALAAYEQQTPGLPVVWRFAFDAANQDGIAPIQKLLLGVNAHINFDLVLTLHDLLRTDWPGLPDNRRMSYYSDYCFVNQIIGETIDTVQDQILEPIQPSMQLVDDLMGRVDEWLISRLITHWRDKVWQNAEALLEAGNGNARDRVVAAVENRALRRAEALSGKNWPLSISDIL